MLVVTVETVHSPALWGRREGSGEEEDERAGGRREDGGKGEGGIEGEGGDEDV